MRLLSIQSADDDGRSNALQPLDEDGVPAALDRVLGALVSGQAVMLAETLLVAVKFAAEIPGRVAPAQDGRSFPPGLGLVVGHAAGHGGRVEQRLRARQRVVDDGGAVGGAQGVAQDVADDPGVLAGEVGKSEGALLPAQVLQRARGRRERVEHGGSGVGMYGIVLEGNGPGMGLSWKRHGTKSALVRTKKALVGEG